MSRPPDPPDEAKNIITKLANFVVRNGPQFEEMTKKKQQHNEKFSFLFGGLYHEFYQWRLQVERDTNNHGADNHAYQGPGNQGPGDQGHGNQGHGNEGHGNEGHDVNDNYGGSSYSEGGYGGQQQQQHYTQPPAPEVNWDEVPDFKTFEPLLQSVMDTCTKDSILQARTWVINAATSSQKAWYLGQFLLFKASEQV